MQEGCRCNGSRLRTVIRHTGLGWRGKRQTVTEYVSERGARVRELPTEGKMAEVGSNRWAEADSKDLCSKQTI